MNQLTLAALFLLATHLGLSSGPLRAPLVERLGERGFMAVYSLVALVAIVWLVVAWRAAPYLHLWHAGPWLRGLVLVLMPVPLLLFVAALTGPNPTAIGRTGELVREPRGMLRITRHPMMWGIGLWAILHMATNGDLASLVFFATFAALALAGAHLIDVKHRARGDDGWRAFARATSHVPFQAILEGRQRLVAQEIGLTPVALALGIWALLIVVHPWLFGVGVLP